MPELLKLVKFLRSQLRPVCILENRQDYFTHKSSVLKQTPASIDVVKFTEVNYAARSQLNLTKYLIVASI